MLAPILGGPGDDVPKPMPSPDGTPGTVVTPLGPPHPAPGYGPAFGTAPQTPCPSCGGAAISPFAGFATDPSMLVSGAGFVDNNNNRFWTSAEFLLLWTPTIQTPLPLAMTSPNPFTVNAPFPAGTSVAIGSSDLINPVRLGGRFGAGLWFDPCHLNGLDGGFFFAGPAQRDFAAAATGAISLFRPYVVINTPIAGNPAPPPGRPNFADVVANVGDTGIVRVHTDAFFMGADANYRRQLLGNCGNYVDLLLGFRYLHLDESLIITETGTATPPGGGNPVTASLTDSFHTNNNFYGFQIGMAAHKQWGPWSADILLKVASGPTVSTVEAIGANDFAVNRNIGLFVQDSNSGTHGTTRWSIVPEVNLNVGYQLTPRMRVHVGYTGIYWPNVLRPGDQIDPIIDVTKVPVPPGFPAPAFQPLPPSDPHPVIPFRRADYWAQGLSVGLTIKW
jgi:hypothetical protein